MSGLYDVCHAAGGMTAYEWDRDPKRIGFILARYKFVAKMLTGKKRALEVGCADGFGSRLVRQTVSFLDAIDKDSQSIDAAQNFGASDAWRIRFYVRDFFNPPILSNSYDAVYTLDVFEHIPEDKSDYFLALLRETAPVCIIGTPSLESQTYASALSREGHVNCVSGDTLRAACLRHWSQVFMFGMNDETLHTGFLPMSHYLFALCVR